MRLTESSEVCLPQERLIETGDCDCAKGATYETFYYYCGMDVILILIFVVIPLIWLSVFKLSRKNHYFFRRSLEPGQIAYLEQHIPFYRGLDAKMRARFDHRAALFLKNHNFLGREGLMVTEEMKMVVTGTAIHLSFGLSEFLFTPFQDILIYPDVYFSPESKTYNKGEANPHGLLVFSWPHLLDGFRTEEDKINLGYHEFAHAALLMEASQTDVDMIDSMGYEVFSLALVKYKIAQKAQELNFLRDYAFTNKMEFFAVCTEHFLEKPGEMNEKFPELYLLMSFIYHMDPIRKNYSFRHMFYGEDAAIIAKWIFG
jgi:Mlc titration factor MtfA (ptsG expression regulator)